MSLVNPSEPTTGREARRHRGLRGFFQKYFTAPNEPASAPPARRASPAASVRPPLGARTTSAASNQSPSGSRPVTPLRSRHPPSGVTVADRPITQPRPERRRRRRRRTQSPVGLPIYSERPTENEMSLFKSHDDAFGPQQLEDNVDEEDEEAEEDDEDDLEQMRAVESGEDDEDEEAAEDEDAFFAMPPRRSTEISGALAQRRASGNAVTTLADGTARPTMRGRPRAASEPLGPQLSLQTTRSSLARSVIVNNANSPYLHGSSSPFASRSGLIELPPRPPSPPEEMTGSPASASSRSLSFRPSYFAHRSTRSSPGMTPPTSSPVIPSSTSMGSLGGSRPRASTLQKLMSRSAGASSTSLALPPGAEAAEPGSGRSPYGSMGSRASSSQVSLGGRSISAPLANSFVHSSFVFPKTGPTPEQVAFISSREAIGAYGYGAGASPPPPLHITLSGQDTHADIPAAADSLSAPPAIQGRARSGSSTSVTSAGGSPLAREVLLPEGRADAASSVDMADGIDLTLPELDEPDSPPPPLTPPPVLPPLPTLEAIADLSLTAETEENPFDRAMLAIGSGGLQRANRPPAITTSGPTPTASAAPSPGLTPVPPRGPGSPPVPSD